MKHKIIVSKCKT